MTNSKNPPSKREPYPVIVGVGEITIVRKTSPTGFGRSRCWKPRE